MFTACFGFFSSLLGQPSSPWEWSIDHQWFDNLTSAIAPVSRRDSLSVVGASLAARLFPALGAEDRSVRSSENWHQPTFNDSGFKLGQAAFDSGGDCPLRPTVRTIWPSNSQAVSANGSRGE